jgi:glycosyltransferase involved in cell wall biosynthesis
MPNPMVSVIVPTRNRRALVVRAVNSVLRQDFPDREILVVDDGSTDGTGDALAAISGCRVIRLNHGGPAAARNRGIAAAAGQYLAFLDSDDYWHECHLSSLLAVLDRPRVGLAYSPIRTELLNGQPLLGRRDCRKYYTGQVARPLFEHVFIHTSNVLCRADLVRQVGGFDESLPVCEDYHLWLRLALRCEVARIDPVTAIRCWHGAALSRQDRVRNAVVRAAMLERFYLTEGGRTAVPPKPAFRRLGKVFFQAGRALARAGQRADAIKFFSRSLKYRPLHLRAWAGCAACRLRPDQADSPVGVQRLLEQLAWVL